MTDFAKLNPAAHLTALQAASWNMAERYSEMLAQRGMLAENSPTVSAVVNALNSEREAPHPVDLIRALRDTLHDATEWMDGCGAQYRWPESIETGTALAQAEDWLAEHGE